MNRAAEKALADFISRFGSTESSIVTFMVSELASGNLARLRDRRQAAQRVRAALAKLRGASLPRLPGLVRTAYISGQRRSKTQMLNLSTGDREAIKILVDNLEGRLDETIDTVGRRTDDIFRKEGLRAAAVKIAQQGIPDASKVMISNLEKRGIKSFVDRTGREWGLETYARMATRATMQEAESHGARNLILRQGFDLVQIAYPSGRDFDPDSACSPHHLKIYSLTGRTPDHPVLEQLPPFHNECFHYIRLAPGAVEERRRAA